jgi:nickel transport protein
MLERVRIAGRSLGLTAAVVLLCQAAAFAHNMRVFADVTGRTITGNAYMSGGGNPRNAQVIVLGPDGKQLGRTTTDEKGNFRFDATVRCDHTFVIDSGDGHRAECTVRAEELPKSLPGRGNPIAAQSRPTVTAQTQSMDSALATLQPERPAAAASRSASPGTTLPGGPVTPTTPATPSVSGPGNFAPPAALDPNALRELVARTVRNELGRYEQRRHFREVVAGIGYIFGTWGVMMLVLRHKKRHDRRPGG